MTLTQHKHHYRVNKIVNPVFHYFNAWHCYVRAFIVVVLLWKLPFFDYKAWILFPLCKISSTFWINTFCLKNKVMPSKQDFYDISKKRLFLKLSHLFLLHTFVSIKISAFLILIGVFQHWNQITLIFFNRWSWSAVGDCKDCRWKRQWSSIYQEALHWRLL